jgi:S1-C subfamily serine protease
MVKKLIRTGFRGLFWLAVFTVIGGTAGIVGDRFVFPWLSSYPSLKKFEFIQQANKRVTVINRTEKVIVKEDFSVAKTAENILPAVVSIIVYEKQEQLLSRPVIKSSRDIQGRIKTGLVLTSDGLLVSVLSEEERTALNSSYQKAEEVLKKKEYRILMGDGKEFPAKLVAIDRFSELVFYKANANNLAVANLGDSSSLENGEKLIICGNASGEYQNTFSLGVIKERDKTFSLLNSELSSSEKLEGAILSNATIDFSNRGGPAIDFNGTAVGIANSIEKDGQKVSFVIPISVVKEAMERVIQQREIKRPSLGVYYLSINPEIALLNNLSIKEGALVYSFSGQQGLAVIKNSPADKAGIKIGDIVTEVAGEKVDLDHPLSRLIAQHQSGEEIEIKILRGGKNEVLKVKLD